MATKLWGFGRNTPVEDTLLAINSVISTLNEEFENFSIVSVKSAYATKRLEPLNLVQIQAFQSLNDTLKKLTKDELSEYNPECYFAEDFGGFEPSTPLYALKNKLIDLDALLGWLTSTPDAKVQAEAVLTETKALITEKITTISEIVEDYGKFIFATKLKYLAKKHDLTQADLAQKLQIRQQTVSDWYRQKAYPSIDKAIQLSLLLHTSVDFLVRPDVKEVDLANDQIYKDTGLTTASIEKLRGSKGSEGIDTLNLLLEHYCSNPDTDILRRLDEFLKMPYEQSLFVVTEDDLKLIANLVADSSTLDDAQFEVNNYIKDVAAAGRIGNNEAAFGSAYSTSTALLMTISKTLVRVRDKLTAKEY